MASGVTRISSRRGNGHLCFQARLAPITPYNTSTSRCKLVPSFPNMVHNSSQSRSLIQRTTAMHMVSVRQRELNWESQHPMVTGATHLVASKLCSKWCKLHSRTMVVVVGTTRGWQRVLGRRSRRRETTKSVMKSNNRWPNTDVTRTFSLRAAPVAKSAAHTAPKSTQASTQTTSLIRRSRARILTIFSRRLPVKIGSSLVYSLADLLHRIILSLTITTLQE